MQVLHALYILNVNKCFWIESEFNQVSGSGSGSRRANITHKNRKKLRNFMFWSAGCSLLRAESLSCSLDVLYGGQGISKVQFLQKHMAFFSAVNFFKFLVIKPLVPDWMRIVIQPTILDPDPDPDAESMNPNPKHWCKCHYCLNFLNS